MTGARIEIRVDDTGAQAAFARLREAALDVTPLLREIGDELVEERRSRFRRGTGPDGIAWPPKKRVIGGKDKTLIFSGALMASLTRRVAGDELEVGSDLQYAAIHQFGGDIRLFAYRRKVAFRRNEDGFLRFAKAGKGKAKGVELKAVTYAERLIYIPARPYLDLDAADRTAIADAAAKHLARVLPGPTP